MEDSLRSGGSKTDDQRMYTLELNQRVTELEINEKVLRRQLALVEDNRSHLEKVTSSFVNSCFAFHEFQLPNELHGLIQCMFYFVPRVTMICYLSSGFISTTSILC